jgi:hypothetical protein
VHPLHHRGKNGRLGVTPLHSNILRRERHYQDKQDILCWHSTDAANLVVVVGLPFDRLPTTIGYPITQSIANPCAYYPHSVRPSLRIFIRSDRRIPRNGREFFTSALALGYPSVPFTNGPSHAFPHLSSWCTGRAYRELPQPLAFYSHPIIFPHLYHGYYVCSKSNPLQILSATLPR